MPHGIATRNDVVTLRRPGRHATGADPRPCILARPWRWGMGRTGHVDVPVSGYLAIERALSAPLDSGARAAGLVG